VSIDLTVRYPFHFKYKMFSAAIERGVRFELCYGPGIAAFDSTSRQRVIENATALIRTTRGRGLIISSEAANVLSCRAPADIVNLAAIWGLGQERGMEAVTKEARSCAVSAQIKRTSYRGVVDVVYAGEKPVKESIRGNQEKNQGKGKRKAAEMTVEPDKNNADKPLSKRQMKKMAAEVRKANGGTQEADGEKNGGQSGATTDVDPQSKP
jgi:ribonuclease P/MRP protein subunit RPP1